MRKIILSQHSTLDGFVAGTNGQMDWIKLDDELFELVHTFTDKADTALYGRITFEMMDGYWPSAAEKPNATKHDIEHSGWYNRVDKIVLSRTLKGKGENKTRFISDRSYLGGNKRVEEPARERYFNFWKSFGRSFTDGI